MTDLALYQYVLIGLIFTWSGFVRSGLGFGGAVMSLPFLLLIDNQPLVFLPIIAVHLLVFSSLTVWLNAKKARSITPGRMEATAATGEVASVDWRYLRKTLLIMIVPKLVGVFGLLNLPANILTGVIFVIVGAYAVSYLLNRPLRSGHPALDVVFLILGAYISGTSLIGAPLIVAVFTARVAKARLRDTLFVLWFILVAIKMMAFVYAGVDLQLLHHLWLLPAATLGHMLGLGFHKRIVSGDPRVFYRVVGAALLATSLIGVGRIWGVQVFLA